MFFIRFVTRGEQVKNMHVVQRKINLKKGIVLGSGIRFYKDAALWINSVYGWSHVILMLWIGVKFLYRTRDLGSFAFWCQSNCVARKLAGSPSILFEIDSSHSPQHRPSYNLSITNRTDRRERHERKLSLLVVRGWRRQEKPKFA